MGCFVYAIFGSCRPITLGPTAILALMTYSAVGHLSIDFAILGELMIQILV
jgi:sodium-independent sulfate anion transporter 11